MTAYIPTLLTVWSITAAVFLVIGCLKPRPPVGPCRRCTDARDDLPVLLQEQAD